MRRKVQTIGWLTALFALALLWVSPAMAKDYGFSIAGTQVTDENCKKLSEINGVVLKSGWWSKFEYDPVTNTLIIRDVTIEVGNNVNAISNEENDGLTIKVLGENKLKSTDFTTLRIQKSTRLEGSGKLSLESTVATVFLPGGDLTVSGIILSISGRSGIEGLGREKVQVKNALVTLKGEKTAARDLAAFDIEGVTITKPLNGKVGKGGIVDESNNLAKEVKIEPIRYNLYIGDTKVDTRNCKILNTLKCVKAGELEYDHSTKTLIIRGVTIDVGMNEPAIWNTGIDNLKIVVEGVNKLISTNVSAIVTWKPLQIQGLGSLAATSGSNGLTITKNDATVTINDVTLSLSGIYGIGAGSVVIGKVKVNNARISLKGSRAATDNLAAFDLVKSTIILPSEGSYSAAKKAIVGKDGNPAKEVEIRVIEEDQLYIAGTKVTESNCNNLETLYGVQVKDGGELRYDPTTRTLKMRDVKISCPTEAIACTYKEELTIEVYGKCELQSRGNGLFLNTNTLITGDGQLNIVNSLDGIVALKNLTTHGIFLSIYSKNIGIRGLQSANIELQYTYLDASNDYQQWIEGFGEFKTKGCYQFDCSNWAAESHKIVSTWESYFSIRPAFTINLVPVSDTNCNDLSKIPGVTVADGGVLKCDLEKNILTMKDVTTFGNGGKLSAGFTDLTIVIDGICHCNQMIWAGHTTLTGTGELTLGNYTPFYNGLVISEVDIKGGIIPYNDAINKELTLKNVAYEGSLECDLVVLDGCHVISPEGAKWDATKKQIVNADGNSVIEGIKIVRTVRGVELTPTLPLKVGDSHSLTAKIIPSNAGNLNVTWSSDKPEVATVENGLVKAVAQGEATITVTTADGGKTATCKVTVSQASSPDNPNGVEDALLESITIAPNPFSEQLQIVHNTLCGTYTLLNAQGIVVLSGNLNNTSTYLNTAALPAGVYHLQLTAANGTTKTYRVVKN